MRPTARDLDRICTYFYKDITDTRPGEPELSVIIRKYVLSVNSPWANYREKIFEDKIRRLNANTSKAMPQKELSDFLAELDLEE